MSEVDSKLTPEVRAMIGTTGPLVECWGEVERDGLRRFTQALMDPDPLYWDDDYARGTRFGQVATPPLYPTYLVRSPAGGGDWLDTEFAANPDCDGLDDWAKPGSLPPIPTDLKRVLNGGMEMEIYQYPALGDRIRFQNVYSDIRERQARDGAPMLFVTQTTTWTNQDGAVLCVTHQSLIHR